MTGPGGGRVKDYKGWLVMSKLKKINKDLSDLGATWPSWLPTYVKHIAQLAPKSNKVKYQKSALNFGMGWERIDYQVLVRRGKIHSLVAKLQTKRLLLWSLSWFSCDHVSPSLKVVSITPFTKDPYDTFGCMNTFYLLGKYSYNNASPSLKVVGITLIPKDPYDTFG